MTSKQRSRNAFIRESKTRFSLNQKQANRLYSEWSKKYGGIVRASDIVKHPIVGKRLAEKVSRSGERSQGRKLDIERPRGGGVSKGSGGASSGGGGLAPRQRVVKTLADWYDVYDFYDYEPVEYESSADYGEV